MNLIISGPTCCGKTTLSNKIKSLDQEGVSIIPQDSYYKDLVNIPKSQKGYLMDSINAFHQIEYIEDANNLMTKGYVDILEYDISENKRTPNKIRINKSKINVFEGLHTIYLLKGLTDSIRVYMDTDIDICLKRRIERDIKFGIPIEVIKRHFHENMMLMYEYYIKPQKSMADIVISKEGDEECLLQKLRLY